MCALFGILKEVRKSVRGHEVERKVEHSGNKKSNGTGRVKLGMEMEMVGQGRGGNMGKDNKHKDL